MSDVNERRFFRGDEQHVPATVVASLVCAVLFWPAGLVLSLVSLRQVPKSQGIARALSFVALAFSFLQGVVVVMLFCTVGFALP